MDMRTTDVLVAGGGIAGLTAALRLGTAGFRTLVVDPMPRDAPGDDRRTTALLHPSIELLRRVGAWEAMAEDATPLRVMRLVDAGGPERRAREIADFQATEVGQDLFGYNVPNIAARRALIGAIEAAPDVELIDRAVVESALPRSHETLVRLTGETVRARLLVAADGRDSRLRQAAGIRARRWSLGQKALVLTVAHEGPHRGISTEIHRTGGPCTLVPVGDRDGRPCSAVVWMMPAERADALLEASAEAVGREITAETLGLYGPLQVVSEPVAWPIVSQAATRLVAERLVLIAEAAHVMPPIGAQGLNTSLADIEALATILAEARTAGRDIGGAAVLRRYERARLPDLAARMAAIEVLNRAAKTEAQPLRDLRRLGLKAIHGLPPLRRAAMRAGLGG